MDAHKNIKSGVLGSGTFKSKKIVFIESPTPLISLPRPVLKSLLSLRNVADAAAKRVKEAELFIILKNNLESNTQHTALRPKTFGFIDNDEMAKYLVNYFSTMQPNTKIKDFLSLKFRRGHMRRLKGKLFERMIIQSPGFQRAQFDMAAFFVQLVLRGQWANEGLITASGVKFTSLLSDNKIEIVKGMMVANLDFLKISDPKMYTNVRIKLKKPIEINGKPVPVLETTDVWHLVEIELSEGKKIQALALQTEIKTEGAIAGAGYQHRRAESRWMKDNVEMFLVTDSNGESFDIKPNELLLHTPLEIGTSPYKLAVSPPTMEDWGKLTNVQKRKFEAALRRDGTLADSVSSIDFNLTSSEVNKYFAVYMKGTVMVSPHHLELFCASIFNIEK